jgi:hypothetical protein
MILLYKLTGTDQILAELIETGNRIICSDVHKLINSTSNTEELPEQWKESIVTTCMKGDKMDCNI